MDMWSKTVEQKYGKDQEVEITIVDATGIDDSEKDKIVGSSALAAPGDDPWRPGVVVPEGSQEAFIVTNTRPTDTGVEVVVRPYLKGPAARGKGALFEVDNSMLQDSTTKGATQSLSKGFMSTNMTQILGDNNIEVTPGANQVTPIDTTRGKVWRFNDVAGKSYYATYDPKERRIKFFEGHYIPPVDKGSKPKPFGKTPPGLKYYYVDSAEPAVAMNFRGLQGRQVGVVEYGNGQKIAVDPRTGDAWGVSSVGRYQKDSPAGKVRLAPLPAGTLLGDNIGAVSVIGNDIRALNSGQMTDRFRQQMYDVGLSPDNVTIIQEGSVPGRSWIVTDNDTKESFRFLYAPTGDLPEDTKAMVKGWEPATAVHIHRLLDADASKRKQREQLRSGPVDLAVDESEIIPITPEPLGEEVPVRSGRDYPWGYLGAPVRIVDDDLDIDMAGEISEMMRLDEEADEYPSKVVTKQPPVEYRSWQVDSIDQDEEGNYEVTIMNPQKLRNILDSNDSAEARLEKRKEKAEEERRKRVKVLERMERVRKEREEAPPEEAPPEEAPPEEAPPEGPQVGNLGWIGSGGPVDEALRVLQVFDDGSIEVALITRPADRFVIDSDGYTYNSESHQVTDVHLPAGVLPDVPEVEEPTLAPTEPEEQTVPEKIETALQRLIHVLGDTVTPLVIDAITERVRATTNPELALQLLAKLTSLVEDKRETEAALAIVAALDKERDDAFRKMLGLPARTLEEEEAAEVREVPEEAQDTVDSLIQQLLQLPIEEEVEEEEVEEEEVEEEEVEEELDELIRVLEPKVEEEPSDFNQTLVDSLVDDGILPLEDAGVFLLDLESDEETPVEELEEEFDEPIEEEEVEEEPTAFEEITFENFIREWLSEEEISSLDKGDLVVVPDRYILTDIPLGISAMPVDNPIGSGAIVFDTDESVADIQSTLLTEPEVEEEIEEPEVEEEIEEPEVEEEVLVFDPASPGLEQEPKPDTFPPTSEDLLPAEAFPLEELRTSFAAPLQTLYDKFHQLGQLPATELSQAAVDLTTEYFDIVNEMREWVIEKTSPLKSSSMKSAMLIEKRGEQYYEIPEELRVLMMLPSGADELDMATQAQENPVQALEQLWTYVNILRPFGSGGEPTFEATPEFRTPEEELGMDVPSIIQTSMDDLNVRMDYLRGDPDAPAPKTRELLDRLENFFDFLVGQSLSDELTQVALEASRTAKVRRTGDWRTNLDLASSLMEQVTSLIPSEPEVEEEIEEPEVEEEIEEPEVEEEIEEPEVEDSYIERERPERRRPEIPRKDYLYLFPDDLNDFIEQNKNRPQYKKLDWNPETTPGRRKWTAEFNKQRDQWIKDRPSRAKAFTLRERVQAPSFTPELMRTDSDWTAKRILPGERIFEDASAGIAEARQLFNEYRDRQYSLSAPEQRDMVFQAAKALATTYNALRQVPRYRPFVDAALELGRSPDLSGSIDEQMQTIGEMLTRTTQFVQGASQDVSEARENLAEGTFYREDSPVWVDGKQAGHIESFEPSTRTYDVVVWEYYPETIPWMDQHGRPNIQLTDQPVDQSTESGGGVLDWIKKHFSRTAQMSLQELSPIYEQVLSHLGNVRNAYTMTAAGDMTVDQMVEALREAYEYYVYASEALGLPVNPDADIMGSDPVVSVQVLLNEYGTLSNDLEKVVVEQRQKETELAETGFLPGAWVWVKVPAGTWHMGQIESSDPMAQESVVNVRQTQRLSGVTPDRLSFREPSTSSDNSMMDVFSARGASLLQRHATLENLALGLLQEVATSDIDAYPESARLKLIRASDLLSISTGDSEGVNTVLSALDEGNTLLAKNLLNGLLLYQPTIATAELADWELDVILQAADEGDDDIITTIVSREKQERQCSWEPKSGPHQYYLDEDLANGSYVPSANSQLEGDERGSQFMMTLRNW